MFHNRRALRAAVRHPFVAAGGGGVFNDPVHQWWLDDANVISGVAQDTGSGSPLTVTVVGGVTSAGTFSGAVKSTCRAFSGAVGTVLRGSAAGGLPLSPAGGTPYSIAAWVSLADWSTSGSSATRATFVAWDVDSSDTNMIRVLNDTSAVSTGAIAVNAPGTAGIVSPASLVPTGTGNAGTFVHFCYTDTGAGATKKLYINGNLVTTSAGSGGIGFASFAVGAADDGTGGGSGAGTITGRIYRLETWGRVLSALDVSSLFAAK